MTTETLPTARSWRVTKDNRWRAESTCPTHGRKTTRFRAVHPTKWIFECPLGHEFEAAPAKQEACPS